MASAIARTPSHIREKKTEVYLERLFPYSYSLGYILSSLFEVGDKGSSRMGSVLPDFESRKEVMYFVFSTPQLLPADCLSTCSLFSRVLASIVRFIVFILKGL